MQRLLSSLLVVTAVSAPLYAQCSDADRKALEQFDRAWGDATTRGDRAALQRIIADDFAGAGINGTVGKAATIDGAVATAERNRASPQAVPSTTYDNYIITCTPNSATVTHRNTTVSTAGGREQTSYSRSVHVLEKRSGAWVVVGNAGHALDDAAVLLYLENDWNQAFMSKDAAWFERNYAPDVTEVDAQTGALRGKADAIAAVKADRAVLESLELSAMNVRTEGNTAIVTGVNRVRGKDEKGAPMDIRVRFTDTFVKRDGRWMIWATHGTRIP
ncbi:MAG TPA: nuclear transport factor 2 family protein [Gemmatimonadales bacterium]|nr:nuclear transport factor 2 family protein [Gemmatimonadales bacterium]